MRRRYPDTTVMRWHRNFLYTNYTLPEFAREIGVSPRKLMEEFRRLELAEKGRGYRTPTDPKERN